MLSNFHYLLWSEAWKNPKIFSLMVWSFPFAKYWFFPTFLQQRKQIHVTGTREIQARGQTSCIDLITLKSSTMSPNQRNKTFPMRGVCPWETFDLLLFLWLVLSPRGTEGHLHGTSAVGTAAGDRLLPQPACQSACCPGEGRTPHAAIAEGPACGVRGRQCLCSSHVCPDGQRRHHHSPEQDKLFGAVAVQGVWPVLVNLPWLPDKPLGRPASLQTGHPPSEQCQSAGPSETVNAVGVSKH